MSEPISRKYILILSGISVVVLAAGYTLKPKKQSPEPPTRSETAFFQRMRQREELRGMAGFLSERAISSGQQVVWVEERKASGVAWGKPGQALSIGLEEMPFSLVSSSSNVSPSRIEESETGGGRWLILLARTPSGELTWTPAIDGGTRAVTCAGFPHRELVLNTPIGATLAGAGAFDLDGVLAGVVARCGEGFSLLSAIGLRALIETSSSPENRLRARYGIRVKPVDEVSGKLLGSDRGLMISELANGSVADTAGLRAGDVIIAHGEQSITTVQELVDALAQPTPPTLSVIRFAKKIAISFEQSKVAGLGIAIEPPRGLPVTVARDSAAWRAGLRSGDRLLQIGLKLNPSAVDLQRAIATLRDTPLLVVYERETRQVAALVAK